MSKRKSYLNHLTVTLLVSILFFVRFLVAYVTRPIPKQILPPWVSYISAPKFQFFFVMSQILFAVIGLGWFIWSRKKQVSQNVRLLVYALSLSAIGGLILFLVER